MGSELPVNWLFLAMGILGGLGLFLYGLQQLTDAMKALAGARLKNTLERLTSSTVRGAVVGAIATAAVQSSSVTTVLVVGFISAGLMSLQQSVGVILGANVGSTFTAQVVAFNVTEWALGMVAVGFALTVPASAMSKRWGAALFGLGLLFLGMGAMSDATRPLRGFPPFIALLESFQNPFLGMAAGALFTAVVQSSGATSGIVIVLASQGVLTLEAGIAVILGANIGTCATAFLATIGRTRVVLQAALLHLFFNLGGALVWLPLIPVLAALSQWLSPASAELEGAARLAAEVPRQIANAHTSFNLINMLVCLPFAGALARLVERILPSRALPSADSPKPLFLADEFLESPDAALAALRRELAHEADLVLRMVKSAPDVVRSGSRERLEHLADTERDIDAMHRLLIQYGRRISALPLHQAHSMTLHRYMAIANQLELAGDIIETRILSAGREALTKDLEMSQGTREFLRPIHAHACSALEAVRDSLADLDPKPAIHVVRTKRNMRELVESARARVLERLAADDPNRVETYRLESSLIDSYWSLYRAARRAAKELADNGNGARSVPEEGNGKSPNGDEPNDQPPPDKADAAPADAGVSEKSE